ncbi:hypothetical protein MYX65_01405 [Acidobacteria bacterium AH-259-L09]|nr:hypothetical protein [Acidobacteria bacterium AH-259-L09]
MIQKAEALLKQVDEFQEEINQELNETIEQFKKLTDAAAKISESWSGSWLGYHSELYYGDFEKPPLQHRFSPEWGGTHGLPPRWKAREEQDVKARIEQIADVQFDAVEPSARELVKRAREVQTEILVEISPLYSVEGLEKEKELLKHIEKHRWGHSAETYVNANIPQGVMTRDTSAGSQGFRIPAHVYYEAIASEHASRCVSIETFVNLARRFLRQTLSQLDHLEMTGSREETSTTIELVKLICRRFHLVAKQLTSRREGRPTLEISDEYDVQDLLHALLRLHFDDIRPEEWTPSYAGSASRMDFLLKPELLVVEAKRTRKNLGAKEVANELTIDAARYKEHPDCSTLVCFIYDPDSIIENPRGVEADLGKLSSAELTVLAIIVP